MDWEWWIALILVIIVWGFLLCLYTAFGWLMILACWVTDGESSFGRQSCEQADRALTVYMWEIIVILALISLPFVFRLPTAIAWLHFVFVPHPAAKVIKRATDSTDAPLDAPGLARRLRLALEAHTPPLAFVSKNMERKAQKLRERAEAQRLRYEEETRLAHKAIDMERSRRARNDHKRN